MLINQLIYFLETEVTMGSINVLEKENNIVNVNNNVENMIYEIRGVQVMLSSDVAKLLSSRNKKN